MTETMALLARINGFLGMMNENPLEISSENSSSELALLRAIKREYTARLLQQMPRYRALPSEDLIPDALLIALRQREGILQAVESSQ